MNVKINFITDGDIAGALTVIGENPKNDIYYSTGGGPEGVIVAAALSCYGGQIQGRLVLNEDENFFCLFSTLKILAISKIVNALSLSVIPV